jgi:hydrogenase maturation protease
MNRAIIGIGNPLMGDDGAGLAVLARLARMPLPEGIALLDGGTAGVGLLHILAGLDAAVLVDAMDFGGVPGEIRTFAPSEVRSLSLRPRLSLHEADVLQVIALAARLGQCPSMIALCAIQPERIAPCCVLSSIVEANLAALAQAACTRIQLPPPWPLADRRALAPCCPLGTA